MASYYSNNNNSNTRSSIACLTYMSSHALQVVHNPINFLKPIRNYFRNPSKGETGKNNTSLAEVATIMFKEIKTIKKVDLKQQ